MSYLVIWILSAMPLFVLLILSVILLRNVNDFTPLPAAESIDSGSETTAVPRLSVCVPARNEAENIGACLDSLVPQSSENYEVLVYDDLSEDRTATIAEHYGRNHPNIRVIRGQEKPEGWLGKNYACHQLAQQATGELIVFLDADCRLHRDTLMRITDTMEREDLSALTIWPQQILKSPLEHIVIPAFYYALLTFLPVVYTHRKPRWMPAFVYRKVRHWFAAACGQCIAFRREVYEAIGGHAAVKTEVVEDVELARKLRRHGYRLKMFNGTDSVTCRMYTSPEQIKEGFRKNFLAGFGYRTGLFLVAGLLHFWVYLLPLLLLSVALIWKPALFMVLLPAFMLIVLHRLLLSLICDWPLRYFWTQPAAVLWFLNLAFISLLDYYQNRKVSWKNRPVR